MEHPDDCVCSACETEADRLRKLILDAVLSGRVSEEDVLKTIIDTTERPEVVALVEDYRLRKDDK